jgi:cell division septation protein DedD
MDPDMDMLVNSAKHAADQISDNNTITRDTKKENPLIVPDVDEKTLTRYSETASSESSEVIHKSDGFAIIIGAFKIRENALKCVQDAISKGLNAGIYDRSRSGLYRVALTTTNKQKQAESLLSEARSKGFSGAWLLAK